MIKFVAAQEKHIFNILNLLFFVCRIFFFIKQINKCSVFCLQTCFLRLAVKCFNVKCTGYTYRP